MIFGSKSPVYSRLTDSLTTYNIDVINSNVILISGATTTGLSVGQKLWIYGTDIVGTNYAFAYITEITNTTTLKIDTTMLHGASMGSFLAYRSLGESKLELSLSESHQSIRQSVFTGVRKLYKWGNYSSAEVVVQLLKIQNTTIRKAVATALVSDNGTEVYLMPHRDGGYIKDSAGNKVKFAMNVSFHNLSTDDMRDIAVVTFTSMSYTDISKSLI